MSKPVKDWTLEETQRYCQARKTCKGCLFSYQLSEEHDIKCNIGDDFMTPDGWCPDGWPLDDEREQDCEE